jgi:preprotein translocase SecE subunit
MNVAAYFQGVATEFRKVTWPTMPVVLRNFFAVLLGMGLATLLVGAFDFLFIKLLGFII